MHEHRFSWDGQISRKVVKQANLRDKVDKTHNYVEIINPWINGTDSRLHPGALLLHFNTAPSSVPAADCNTFAAECLMLSEVIRLFKGLCHVTKCEKKQG